MGSGQALINKEGSKTANYMSSIIEILWEGRMGGGNKKKKDDDEGKTEVCKRKKALKGWYRASEAQGERRGEHWMGKMEREGVRARKKMPEK